MCTTIKYYLIRVWLTPQMWNRGAVYRGPTINCPWIFDCAAGGCPNLQSVFKCQQYFLLVCGLSLHPLIRVFHRSNILNFVEVQFIDFLFFFFLLNQAFGGKSELSPQPPILNIFSFVFFLKVFWLYI